LVNHITHAILLAVENAQVHCRQNTLVSCTLSGRALDNIFKPEFALRWKGRAVIHLSQANTQHIA